MPKPPLSNPESGMNQDIESIRLQIDRVSVADLQCAYCSISCELKFCARTEWTILTHCPGLVAAESLSQDGMKLLFCSKCNKVGNKFGYCSRWVMSASKSHDFQFSFARDSTAGSTSSPTGRTISLFAETTRNRRLVLAHGHEIVSRSASFLL